MEKIVSMNCTVPLAAQDRVGKPGVRRVNAALVRWWGAHHRRRIEQLAIEQLAAMSDRELKDIGLIRPEISRAVNIVPPGACLDGSREVPRIKWRGVVRSVR